MNKKIGRAKILPSQFLSNEMFEMIGNIWLRSIG
jgi:hypothetical protein